MEAPLSQARLSQAYLQQVRILFFIEEAGLQHDSSHKFHISVIEMHQQILQTSCFKTWNCFNDLLRRYTELLRLLNLCQSHPVTSLCSQWWDSSFIITRASDLCQRSKQYSFILSSAKMQKCKHCSKHESQCKKQQIQQTI